MASQYVLRGYEPPLVHADTDSMTSNTQNSDSLCDEDDSYKHLSEKGSCRRYGRESGADWESLDFQPKVSTVYRSWLASKNSTNVCIHSPIHSGGNATDLLLAGDYTNLSSSSRVQSFPSLLSTSYGQWVSVALIGMSLLVVQANSIVTFTQR